MDQKFEVVLTFQRRPDEPPLSLARRIMADLKGCVVLYAQLDGARPSGHALTIALQCAAVEKPITRHELRLFVSIVTDRLGAGVRLEDVRQLGIANVERDISLRLWGR